MQEVRPRTSAPVVAGSSSLQRGCLEAVATPREIPWLCVPPSPAVCPLERSYGLRRGKNHAFCEDVPDVKVWNAQLHGIMHYLPQNTVQKEAAGKPRRSRPCIQLAGLLTGRRAFLRRDTARIGRL